MLQFCGYKVGRRASVILNTCGRHAPVILNSRESASTIGRHASAIFLCGSLSSSGGGGYHA